MNDDTPNTPDSWRDVWVDPDTARINARRDEIHHDEQDMAEFYRLARLAARINAD